MFEAIATGLFSNIANKGIDAFIKRLGDSSDEEQKTLIIKALFQDLRRLENITQILMTRAVQEGAARTGTNKLLAQLSMATCETLEASGIQVTHFLDKVQVSLTIEDEASLPKEDAPQEIIVEGVLSEIYDKLLLKVHALRAIGLAEIGIDQGLRVDIRLRNIQYLNRELQQYLQGMDGDLH